MALPKWLARFNLHVSNPILRPLAGVLPFFAVIEHVGRRSGERRRTPVNIFRHGGRYVIALTYGPEVEWLKNVMAAGGCRAKMMGRWVNLVEPRRFSDTERRSVPRVVGFFLAGLAVTEFVELRRA